MTHAFAVGHPACSVRRSIPMVEDFEILVRRHHWAVCAAAYAVLRDRARSEEIAQEAFLLAWQRLPTLTPAPSLPGWICGVARNLARNAARRPRETAEATVASSAATPLELVIDRETASEVERALAALAEGEREVVVLYYRGDQSLAEVAGALRITEATARKRLQRGRDRLRPALASVEASLRATRPSPAFAAACVAALATAATVRGSAAAAAHATAPTISATPAAVVAGLALAALGGAALWFHHGDDATTAAVASAPGASRAVPAAPTSSMASLGGPAGPSSVRRLDAPARQALVAAVASAHQHSAALAPASPLPHKIYDFAGSVLEPVALPVPPPTGPLSKATFRFAMQGIQPYLLECLAGHPAHGALELRLQLSSAPDVGTLVESVDLGGDALAGADPELATCLTETVMSLELAPMAEAATWEVDYPFTLR